MYAQLLSLQPANEVAAMELAELQSATGDLDGAMATMVQSLTAHPESDEALVMLASIHLQLGDAASGIRMLQQASRLAPTNATLKTHLAALYMHEARFEEALGLLQRANRLMPDRIDWLGQLAEAATAAGKLQLAIDAYGQILLSDPDASAARLGLGMLYLKIGNRPSAIDQYQALLELDPVGAYRLLKAIRPN